MTSDAINSQTLPMTSACHLSGLGRWSQQTHLAGIKAVGDLWQLDDDFFSCCGSSGIEVQDLGKRLARLCGLVPRWAQLKEHIHQMMEIFPSQSLLSMLAMDSRSSNASKALETLTRWRTLNISAIQSHSRGRLIVDNAEILPGVTIDWAGAASCIWHDGIRVFVHLHGSGSPPTAKWQREIQASKDQRAIVWIERVHNLFDVAKLLEFDEAISFAATHGLPLWVDVAKSTTESAAQSRKFSKSLDRKLTKYRQGPLEQWLSRQTLGRLREVCDLPNFDSPQKPFVIPPVV